jgi:hypothetical protein
VSSQWRGQTAPKTNISDNACGIGIHCNTCHYLFSLHFLFLFFVFAFIVDYTNLGMSSPQVIEFLRRQYFVMTIRDYKNAKNAQPNAFQ